MCPHSYRLWLSWGFRTLLLSSKPPTAGTPRSPALLPGVLLGCHLQPQIHLTTALQFPPRLCNRLHLYDLFNLIEVPAASVTGAGSLLCQDGYFCPGHVLVLVWGLLSYCSGVVEQGAALSTCKLLLQGLKSSKRRTGSSKTSKTVFAAEDVFLLCSYKAQGSGARARPGCSACAGLAGRLSWGCHGRGVSWEERSPVNLSVLEMFLWWAPTEGKLPCSYNFI